MGDEFPHPQLAMIATDEKNGPILTAVSGETVVRVKLSTPTVLRLLRQLVDVVLNRLHEGLK